MALLVQVSLVQAGNFAWFGYPDDPEPSARNFLPGLAKAGTLTLSHSQMEMSSGDDISSNICHAYLMSVIMVAK